MICTSLHSLFIYVLHSIPTFLEMGLYMLVPTNLGIFGHHISWLINDTWEFAMPFLCKSHALLTKMFNCGHSLNNLHRKALPLEWDALKQPYMSLKSPCLMQHQLEGYKAPQHWAVEQWSSIQYVWVELQWSRTNHSTSVPDLTKALVAKCNQILTAMFQHLV